MAETILDSGERREAGTGSVRDVAKGKGRFDLVPLDIAGRLTGSRELAEIGLYMEDGDTAHIYSAITEFAISEHKDLYTILIELSIHYEAGCAKYGENNWRLGQPISWYISSGARHYNKHKRGDVDEPHDRAFVWNMVGIIWTHNNLPEMIDLPFKGGKSAAHANTGGPSYTCGDCRYIKTDDRIYSAHNPPRYFCCGNARVITDSVTPNRPACSACEPCGKIQ